MTILEGMLFLASNEKKEAMRIIVGQALQSVWLSLLATKEH